MRIKWIKSHANSTISTWLERTKFSNVRKGPIRNPFDSTERPQSSFDDSFWDNTNRFPNDLGISLGAQKNENPIGQNQFLQQRQIQRNFTDTQFDNVHTQRPSNPRVNAIGIGNITGVHPMPDPNTSNYFPSQPRPNPQAQITDGPFDHIQFSPYAQTNFQPNPVAPNPNMMQTQSSNWQPRRRPVPVTAWGISFSGDGRGMHLHDFLSQIRVYQRSESISNNELLYSVIHLLNGRAKLWYLSTHDQFASWTEFEAAIKSEFLPANYEYQLYPKYPAVHNVLANRMPNISHTCKRHSDAYLFLYQRNLNYTR